MSDEVGRRRLLRGSGSPKVFSCQRTPLGVRAALGPDPICQLLEKSTLVAVESVPFLTSGWPTPQPDGRRVDRAGEYRNLCVVFRTRLHRFQYSSAQNAGRHSDCSWAIYSPAAAHVECRPHYAGVVDTLQEGGGDHRDVVRLWPAWSFGQVLGNLQISDELRLRLQNWNRIWQSVLDPIEEIRWPDAEVGREWIAEGESLMSDLQVELGPQVRVVEGFRVYDPDGEQTPGS